MHIASECSHCDAQARSRRREFTDQIWSVLILWGEVDRSLVDNPICDDCYNEFREVLIDRAQELEMALADPRAYEEKILSERVLKKAASGSSYRAQSVASAPKAQAKAPAREKPTPIASKKKAVPIAANKKADKNKKVTKKVAKKETKKVTKKAKKKTGKVGKLAS